MPPTFGNGKICYLEIPALSAEISSSFYAAVFGWKLRQRPDGISFDDGVGEVSGIWVLNRQPAAQPGIMISIMVDDAAATVDLIQKSGGEIVKPINPAEPEITAHFRDPAGNILGIYQHPR